MGRYEADLGHYEAKLGCPIADTSRLEPTRAALRPTLSAQTLTRAAWRSTRAAKGRLEGIFPCVLQDTRLSCQLPCLHLALLVCSHQYARLLALLRKRGCIHFLAPLHAHATIDLDYIEDAR